MKKLFLFLSAAALLAACSQEPQKSTSTDSKVVETAMGKFDSYGEEITPDSAIEVTSLMAEMGNAPTYEAKVKGKVADVCVKKGCWMSLELGNGEMMRITFKDYGFFVPTDKDKMIGKEVIVQGVAKFETISVADQKHYAEDGGESKEVIDAIKEDKNTLSFEAVGVLVAQPTEEKKAI
jgi:Domain of unknown function (DUF4920)